MQDRLAPPDANKDIGRPDRRSAGARRFASARPLAICRPASAAATPSEDVRGAAVDFRRMLGDAASALRQGDLARAHDLYQRVLSAQPGNTEALAGLADVARRRNDSAEAARLYDRVLDNNPSYLPALMARADQQWEAGNKKAAIVLYKRVIDQAGAGSEYGNRAAARIVQAQEPEPGSEPVEGVEGAAPSPSAAPEPSAAPSPPDPGIDTSDLPGVK